MTNGKASLYFKLKETCIELCVALYYARQEKAVFHLLLIFDIKERFYIRRLKVYRQLILMQTMPLVAESIGFNPMSVDRVMSQ